MSGTLSLQTASGSIQSQPVTFCSEYGFQSPDRLALAGCVDDSSGTVCLKILMDTSLSSPATSEPTGAWSFGQSSGTATEATLSSVMRESTVEFLSASVANNTAWVWVAQWVSQDYVLFPGVAGGVLDVSNATIPMKAGDSGSIHVSGQSVPLSGGGNVTFDLTFDLSVEPAGAG